MFKSLAITPMVQEDSDEMIQLINPEQESDLKPEDLPEELSILPIKNTVLFPGVVIPITVTRQKSIRLIKKAYQGNRIIGVIAQKNKQAEEPGMEDLYRFGTVARIIKMLVLPDGNTTIIIQGKNRFQIREYLQDEPFMTARIDLQAELVLDLESKEVKALVQSLKDAATKILKLNPEIPQEAQVALDNIQSTGFLIHFLSSNLNVDVGDKQKILETNNIIDRGTLLLQYMLKEIQMLEIKHEIQKKVHTDIDQQQRDYFLRQQIKVLQDELGYDGPDKEIEKLRKRGAEKKWPKAAADHFNKELDKLQRINPQAAEFPVAMNYVEFMLDLPWDEFTTDDFDLKRARKILDKDHFGLEKVKTRILEYLAVLKLKQDMKGPILCLYGPPGVGKTSLGKSIAKSLQRNYIRMSLGGVHDEAEIRGHRKTYVGAMPGKILQNIKKAKSSNPVFILDEIDKVRSDFRGDPSSALLEVLDPEQNNAFGDNYLEVEYDLSKVLFIATANSLDTIHPALRDRMEIIELTGYTVEEKLQIAIKHLVPKQLAEHGLKSKDVKFSKEALLKVIESYTRESGVRNLERKIGSVVRSIAKSVAMDEEFEKEITPSQVVKVLGAEIFDEELYQGNEIAGVVTGLAWTQVGGDILFVESSLNRGKGQLTISGQLGDVMKESAVAALSYLKSNAQALGIDHRVFQQYDLHIHVPAGAVPKDGPSAGITMLTSLASIFTQRKVKSKLAMTGEITLRGKVLPVGGIKEKILAAKRSGIKEIILSEKNKRDIDEIEKTYIKGLTFHYVTSVEEVLKIALLKEKVAKPVEFVLQEAK
ncbi:MAG TPA: endopeptidase La [Cyclobacteriaceae bacterium]|jgi:ATP-dependent Lon protease|nr:endopeptidase La [Cytophagales bacterium]HMR56198.1 endopeptidase La [Cyclobacteriaceae bacterium]HNT49300.1 endopeptidase La [Cyclobacteriaceae bacterium]HRE66477.1 endopeptidase La [Cyclobacteriaceae bacterium]HRF31990.1 endopeptidase La [Cyclobacteriaceae bacterium]